jgi:drug/metabolite transporter (DMT)-like permease
MYECYAVTCRSIRWCFIVAPPTMEHMSRRDSLLAALVAVLWGFNFVVIDWGMGSVPPLLFAALRFVLVAFPACLLVPRPQAPWRVLAAVGAFMSLGQFGFLYVSMHAGMPPGLAALVLQSQVVFTIVIAAVALRERTSPAQVAGVGLGVAGLAVVALGRDGHVGPGALMLCLLAGLSWGIGNVIARAARVPGGLGLTVWSAVVVPVPLLLLSLLLDGPLPAPLRSGGALDPAGAGGRDDVGLGAGRRAAGPRRGRRRGAAGRRRPGRAGGGAAQAGRPDSVYADPSPRARASAASTRRAVKSAARSRTCSRVQNSADRISRTSRTIRAVSDAGCTPPSKTRHSASSQPLHGGSQSVSSSSPAARSRASSSRTSRETARCGDSPTSTTPPGRSQSRL